MGIVRGSPEMAQPLVVGTDTVFVHTDIEPVTEDQNGNPVENEFQYHEIQYEKLEFEYHDFMSVYCSPWVFNKILQKP